MNRSLLPSVLASLGYVLVLLAMSLPLLDWQINKITTDFPETYKVQIAPYHLVTRVGESLSINDDLIRTKIYISDDGIYCRFGSAKNIILRRSMEDESLEQAFLIFNKANIESLKNWILIGVISSGIYIWLFTLLYKRPILEAVGSTSLAIIIFILLTQLVRPFLWRVGLNIEGFGELDCYQGTVTLDIGLLKMHYETLVLFFAGILLELGALGVMLYQIIRSVNDRKIIPN